MPVYSPRLPASLVRCEQFSHVAERAAAEDAILSQLSISRVLETFFDFSALEIKTSKFESCTFSSCRFSRASFIDVCFENCDFSNSNFNESYFERCEFTRCKGVGTALQETRWKSVQLRECSFELAYLDGAKMSDVICEDCDFSQASCSEVSFKKMQFQRCRFIKNNFFQTSLAGLDFSKSEFAAPTVSASGAELKDCRINTLQAADLITLWGLKVLP